MNIDPRQKKYNKRHHVAMLKYFKTICMQAIKTRANTVTLYNSIVKVIKDLEDAT